MRFNVDRLCELAGIDSSGRLLAESKNPMQYEDDEVDVPAAKPAAGAAPAKPAAKPAGGPPPPMKEKMNVLKGGLKHVDEIDVNDIGEDDYMGTGDDTDLTLDMMEDEGDYAEDDEVVYEIDEQELNEAIYQMRSQRIEEGKVRQQVRRELKQVVSEMTSGSSWMYGNKQPTNSQAGRINRGFAGPGFKR